MGNYVAFKAIGICTVKTKMFDDVIRILDNVKHISELRKNLISLRALDSLGCMYMVKGGVMKINKGDLVIIKGQKLKNLYRLVRSTVVGGVALSTPIESSPDDTKLWHMQLGHIDQCGMLELHINNMLEGVGRARWIFVSIVCMDNNIESISR